MAADSGRFAAAARELAGQIRAEARYARDGRVYWLQPELPGREGPRPPLDNHLYPGSTGVALFFALAGRVLGEPELGGLSREIVEPLRADLRRLAADPERLRALEARQGGLVGDGSWIYGLLRIGDLLGDEALWDDAHRLSVLLSPGRLARNPVIELMGGTAGSLLALLALHERRPAANVEGAAPLGLAQEAGRILLARAGTELPEAIPAEGAGLCHGASGVFLALARLERFSPGAGQREGALKIWDRLGGMATLLGRQEAYPRAGTWCSGAGGILLACLERHRATGESRTALTDSLRSFARRPLDEADHLCCGNLGRVDLLVHAAEILKDEELLGDAEDLAAKVLDRAAADGRFRLMFHPHGAADVRLFPGLAGVGYALLRLVRPRALPTLLAMQ